MILSIVVAVAENGVIGVDNQLPWHLPEDLKFFKRTTLGAPVIMGRNTWLSIGKKLPGRLNIVISSSLRDLPDEVLQFDTLEAALSFLEKDGVEKAYLIGGGQLYHYALDKVEEVWLTRVHTTIDRGTAFFPDLDVAEWEKVWEEAHPADERHNFAFTFEQWQRK